MSEGTPHAGYRSTVIAPAQIALGAVSGAVIAIVLISIRSGLWWLGLLVLLLTIAVGVYLAPVRVEVTEREVDLAQGRGGPDPRSIRTSDIADARAEQLTWPQCFGIGLPEEGTRDTRLTVRAGPTLRLTLNDGEVVRMSVADPNAALAALGREPTGNAVPPEEPTPQTTLSTVERPKPRPRPGA